MMKKNMIIALLIALLCLSAAVAETRQGVIWLEGMEEPVEETLYESPLGFSFWYVSDALEAYPDEMDGIEGVVVKALYTDDYMFLTMLTEEEAGQYIEVLEVTVTGQPVQPEQISMRINLNFELEDGQYSTSTLIGENGKYLLAPCEYSMEAAEGNAKYMDLVLDSIEFAQ